MNNTTGREMTQADLAHLYRGIDHAISYERLRGPVGVLLQPEYGSAVLRFADGDVAAVQAWAALTVAGVAHGGHIYDEPSPPWHEFGTRSGGRQGYLLGWRVDLWCVVAGPAPVAAVPAEAAR